MNAPKTVSVKVSASTANLRRREVFPPGFLPLVCARQLPLPPLVSMRGVLKYLGYNS